MAKDNGANGMTTATGTAVTDLPADVPEAPSEAALPEDSAELEYRASLSPPSWDPIDPDLATIIRRIEEELQRPVLLFVQAGADESVFASVSYVVRDIFLNGELPNEPCAVIIHSLGGFADCAFQIAHTIRRRCGEFIALIPHRAKSAATLLAMGAETIIMSPESHLGPLDAQVMDLDMADRKSALEVVQAVERLRAESLATLESTSLALKMGTGLPWTTLLPHVIDGSVGFMRPLLEKVDVAEYMRMSRSLKIGEEYAAQLMEPIYGARKAREIALQFVRGYPDHGFVITPEEAKTAVKPPSNRPYGLNVEIAENELCQMMDALVPHLRNLTAYGRLDDNG